MRPRQPAHPCSDEGNKPTRSLPRLMRGSTPTPRVVAPLPSFDGLSFAQYIRLLRAEGAPSSAGEEVGSPGLELPSWRIGQPVLWRFARASTQVKVA